MRGTFSAGVSWKHLNFGRILTELFTEAPTDVVSILTCYNYDRNAGDIYNLLNKFRKSQLQEAAEFLQHPTKSFKYKDEVIRGVISRIDSLLLVMFKVQY